MYLYGEPVTAAMRERLPFPQPALQCLDERARQALTSTLLWAAVECVFCFVEFYDAKILRHQ
jgi:hypothetical protein